MFGGETAMENPLAGIPGNSYVPPTLGDTWIFDFDNLTWNRADLLGEGYAGATAPTDISGLQLGSTYSIVGSSATQRELSPPAVSGATMVTRTRGPKGHLAIPEVFLIGGRTKDGAYLPFDHVYKFCMGTAAENAADATCVDYQHVSTLAVQASSKYTGAWIRKAPTVLNLPAGGTVSPNTVASYLGASTYDPVDDKIVLFGGITPNNGVASGFAVTDVANRSFQPYVFEYTPPANSADNGTWTEVGACTGTAPPTTSFYGHSMSYDTLNQQLVIIGGFDLLGAPNVTTLNQPAVYTAKRAVGAGGVPCYNWNPVTTFGNVQGVPALSPPTGGIGYAASLYVPAEGYNTGYYLTYDQSCVDAGPIAVTDPTVNKLYAGGAYFDINRAELGPNENLVLNLTYLPMGQTMTAQDGTPLLAGDEAVFYVHLIHTGESASAIQATIQPLYLTFAATDQYPQLVQELAVLGPKTGYMRSEQIVLPISANPSIDRIQIQRYSGTAVLISASIYRMGYR
jgi:hypothetical protein